MGKGWGFSSVVSTYLMSTTPWIWLPAPREEKSEPQDKGTSNMQLVGGSEWLCEHSSQRPFSSLHLDKTESKGYKEAILAIAV